MQRDKDAAAFARILGPLARAVYATRPQGPRAFAPSDLAAHYRRRRARAFPDLAAALRAAREDAGADEVVCVTGSLALVGEARGLLGLGVPERLWG
jgi:dihydrofolate synthase/folylpolyglutamate synthase